MNKVKVTITSGKHITTIYEGDDSEFGFVCYDAIRRASSVNGVDKTERKGLVYVCECDMANGTCKIVFPVED